MAEIQASERIKVLYIAGAGRSGSTLLSNILGQLPGAFSVGELYYLWERGLMENRLCGCQSPIQECSFWRQVRLEALGTTDVETGRRMIEQGTEGTRTRYLALMATETSRARYLDQMKEYTETLARLYAAIQKTAGSRLIVDASKFPTYGLVLAGMPSIDLYVVHLIRDSRAVANSWQRQKHNPDSGKAFGKISPTRSSAIWDSWNVGSEFLQGSVADPGHFMRVRYEDFTADPALTVSQIAQMAGLDSDIDKVIQDGYVTLEPGHSIAGNPVRFSKTSMQIRPDIAWKDSFAPADRNLVTALTWPLLRRYGYELFPE